MNSGRLWFKRPRGNLPLPPGCGTMEASTLIPAVKSNRPGIRASANRRPRRTPKPAGEYAVG